jgi:hypothetical protein
MAIRSTNLPCTRPTSDRRGWLESPGPARQRSRLAVQRSFAPGSKSFPLRAKQETESQCFSHASRSVLRALSVERILLARSGNPASQASRIDSRSLATSTVTAAIGHPSRKSDSARDFTVTRRKLRSAVSGSVLELRSADICCSNWAAKWPRVSIASWSLPPGK